LKRLSLLSLAAALPLALIGCGSGEAGPVATVNGEPITSKDFHSYLERKPTVQVMSPDGQVVEAPVARSLAFQGMQDLISRRIMAQMAKDEGVYPTEADIMKELEFQTKRRPDFVKLLTAQGLTLEDIKNDLAIDLTRERLLTKGITVTDEEVDQFITENKQSFMTPETADLLFVVVQNQEQRRTVDKELGEGQMFAAVTKRHSVSPDVRQTGGRFRLNQVAAFPEPLKSAVQKTGERRTTDWIEADGMSYKFYVERKAEAKPIEIDDTMKTLVRRQLAMQRGAKANDLSKRLLDKLKDAKIDIEVRALKEPWEKQIEQLKTQEAQQGVGRTTTEAVSTPPGQ
jgi:hypothetical protein